MRVRGRVIGAALVAALTLSTAGSSGCTSMKRIEVAPAGGPVFGRVKAGDEVSLLLKDGRRAAFVVAALDQDSLTDGAGERYRREEIQELKRRSRSVLRTSLLVAGTAVGTFFLAAAIAFAAWS